MSEQGNTNYSVPQAGLSGSPKAQYLNYLLQQCGYHQKIMSTNEEKIYNIERSCLSLISWCPDEEAQDMLFKLYRDKKAEYRALDGSEDSSVVSAAIYTVARFTIYLNKALEFTEKSYGGII